MMRAEPEHCSPGAPVAPAVALNPYPLSDSYARSVKLCCGNHAFGKHNRGRCCCGIDIAIRTPAGERGVEGRPRPISAPIKTWA
jgi:hypothetical protein